MIPAGNALIKLTRSRLRCRTADGTTAPEENRELFVFARHAGEWKISRYMFNKTSAEPATE